MQPLNNEIIVLPLDKADRIGSILLPEIADKTILGKIISIADDVQDMAPGEIAVIRNWIGEKLTLNGIEYIIVNADEVLGIIQNEMPKN